MVPKNCEMKDIRDSGSQASIRIVERYKISSLGVKDSGQVKCRESCDARKPLGAHGLPNDNPILLCL